MMNMRWWKKSFGMVALLFSVFLVWMTGCVELDPKPDDDSSQDSDQNDRSANTNTRSNTTTGNIWNSVSVNWSASWDVVSMGEIRETISCPGATKIRIHFQSIGIYGSGPNDYLVCTAPDENGQLWRQGFYSNITSNVHTGDKIVIILRGQGRQSTPGNFTIDRVEYQGSLSGQIYKTGDLF